MTRERRADIQRWRDATLLKLHGDEGAATRLRKHGHLPDVVASALAIDFPTEDEVDGADITGQPLNPFHPWWGYQGPSAIEIAARRRGLPWPPG